jgi:hypothetical protein
MNLLKILIILNFLFCLFTFSSKGQQSAESKIGLRSVDTNFNYVIKNPIYKFGTGPIITLDEAHFNLHTLSGLYHPFGRLLQNDGYILNPGRKTFTSSNLATTKIVVIANALPDTGEWKLPTKSAFTRQEVIDLNKWVSDGGSLLLIADHMPFPGAASQLALSFGFNLINSYALKKDKQPEIFSRELKNLTSNKITNGRNKSEQVDSIRIFAGSAFIAPQRASIISKLDDNYKIFLPTIATIARERNDTTAIISGHSLVNGAFMEYGKGRVVVFAEAGMFSAQFAGPQKGKMGMNHAQAKQNPQLLLNIIHWLDRRL